MTAWELIGLSVGTKVYTDDSLGVEGVILASDENSMVIRWEDHKTTTIDKHNQILTDFLARGLRVTPDVPRKPGRVSAGRKRKK